MARPYKGWSVFWRGDKRRWELAVRTGNLTLRRLVLRYEAEVEGVSIGGRLVA